MRDVLDLFSGACGGWSLGAHRAGYRTVAACEVDPWRRSVFAHNFPGVRLYDDVRTLTAGRLVSDLGYLPSVIVGSPPCQDASSANTKGKGIEGERTGLFFEAVRIVREIRPRWCAFENSARLRTRGVDRVLGELEALGYACWPLVVRARDVGAPHERERMWLVAADASQVQWAARPRPDLAFAKPASRVPHHPDADRNGKLRLAVDGEVGRELGFSRDADGAGLAVGESLSGDARSQCEALERAVGPRGAAWLGGSAGHFVVAHGLSARLGGTRVPCHDKPGRTVNAARASISAYGDAVLPQITEAIFRAMTRAEHALSIVSPIHQAAAE